MAWHVLNFYTYFFFSFFGNCSKNLKPVFIVLLRNQSINYNFTAFQDAINNPKIHSLWKTCDLSKNLLILNKIKKR